MYVLRARMGRACVLGSTRGVCACVLRCTVLRPTQGVRVVWCVWCGVVCVAWCGVYVCVCVAWRGVCVCSVVWCGANETRGTTHAR